MLRDQDEAGGGALADFRTRCEASAIRAVCCGEVLGKQIDAAEPRARGWTHTHTADRSSTRSKSVPWSKGGLFSKWRWDTGHLRRQQGRNLGNLDTVIIV